MSSKHHLSELLQSVAVIASVAMVVGLTLRSAVAQPSGSPHASRLKQIGTSFIMYSEANNGILPLAFGRDSITGAHRYNIAHSIPAGWRPGAPGEEPRKSEDASMWANSLEPYRRSWDELIYMPFPKYRAATPDYNNPRYPWRNASLNYNGLLHQYSLSAVVRPERLTLVYPASGGRELEGFALSNPTLNCNQTSGPCIFSATGPPQTGAPFAGSAWFGTGVHMQIYKGGAHFVTTDTSVRHLRLGEGDPSSNNRSVDDPFASYSATGVPTAIWTCTNQNATANYVCFFMPTSNFDYF